ncbi:MAG: molybdopterin cofactor-binding domain-containing protein [Pseudomonadota bacterium]
MTAVTTGLTRRRFIKVSLIAGTGLVVACQVPGRGLTDVGPQIEGRENDFAPNVWIRIAADDTVTVMVKHTELGQGTTTGLSMIVAEELEADWSKLKPVIAPVAPEYKNPEMHVMATGGSTGVKTSWDALRLAGAATRELLLEAAAATWKAPVSECRAENSVVTHVPSHKRLRYGELLEKAAGLEPPSNPKLKSPDQFKIIGRPVARLDAEDKARGKTRYGVDFVMPGLLTASVVRPPMVGGKPMKVNDLAARSMPGVRDVVTLESGVAVVAETYWQAENAARAVKVQWKESHPDLSSEGLMAEWAGLIEEKGVRVRDDGQVDRAMRQAVRRLQAIYELPYQAHACPEPMNCTAHVGPERCEVWAPTQSQEVARDLAARITGLPREAVRLHTPFVGGGFGRRGSNEYVVEAVQISQAVKAPVKVIWSRDQDLQHDRFRPASYNRVEAGLDKDGFPLAWVHKAVGPDELSGLIDEGAPSILPQSLPAALKYPLAKLIAPLAKRFKIPASVMSGAVDMCYRIPNVRIEYIKAQAPIPTGAWRSVADSRNAFVKESFMDEIAAASGKDPVDLRLHLLQDDPRRRKVLELAAEKVGWGGRPPEGLFRGVAFHEFHGTPVAMAAEVSIERQGRVRVHRMVCAVDCGIAVNPRLVKAQITGAVAFGLTAALKSKVHIKNGRVRETGFATFPILLFHEMPRVEVHLVPSAAPPTGVGEPGVPPVAPAVTNALFQATGKRIRTLPVEPAAL